MVPSHTVSSHFNPLVPLSVVRVIVVPYGACVRGFGALLYIYRLHDIATGSIAEENTAVQVVVVRSSWVVFYFLRSSTKCLMIALASEMQTTAVDTTIAAA
jgi:uncharacterized membrane protein (DUF106 family)